ncbi:MAG TPA: PD-(D/E)XK nuclease family protein [Alphaproteobacteria bacterium]|nr:PD-(D/E)XK nuclease family protein [Alphaproteobacteria bacterium]
MHARRPVSSAALRRFEQCPLQFWFRDVADCQETSEQTLPAAIGGVVHATLARFFRLPAAQREVEAIEALLRQCWRHFCPRSLFASRQEEASYGRSCIDWLRRYLESTDLSVEPVALEADLQTTLPGGARIHGRLDRVDRLADGGFRVLDYKTGERCLDEDDLRREPAAQIQLLLASAQFGPVESVRFLYLTSGEELVWAPEPEDLPHIAEALAAHIDDIWTKPHYEARPGSHCAHCPFARACPAISSVPPTVSDAIA